MKDMNYARTADLVCFALCREIAEASTWAHIERAWLAIVKVRKLEEALVAEQRHHLGSTVTSEAPRKEE